MILVGIIFLGLDFNHVGDFCSDGGWTWVLLHFIFFFYVFVDWGWVGAVKRLDSSEGVPHRKKKGIQTIAPMGNVHLNISLYRYNFADFLATLMHVHPLVPCIITMRLGGSQKVVLI